MNHQTVGRQAIWQDVIGNPLVEDIVLVEVIVVICRIRITLVIYDPLLHVRRSDLLGRFAQLLFPPLIRLCKDGETVLAMLRSIGISLAHRSQTS